MQLKVEFDSVHPVVSFLSGIDHTLYPIFGVGTKDQKDQNQATSRPEDRWDNVAQLRHKRVG